jgi:hypothetical protein
MDETTYETVFAKLPKYIQVDVQFVYIGKRLPSATQKHFELPWVAEEEYDYDINFFLEGLKNSAVLTVEEIQNAKGRARKSFDTLIAETDVGEPAIFDEEGNL